METLTYNVYKIDELSEDSKRKAVENLCYINVDHEWWEYIEENFKNDMRERGFCVSNIFFSGFSSQGDGACFEIESFDAGAYIKYYKLSRQFPLIARNPQAIFGYIRQNSYATHYSHYNTRYFEINVEQSEIDKDKLSEEKRIAYFNKYEEEAAKLEERIEEEREALSKKLYRDLETEYEYLTSEKAIIETIRANDYDFTEDGKID